MESAEAVPSQRRSPFRDAVVIMTGLSFLLSVVGGLYLAFGPVYQGVRAAVDGSTSSAFWLTLIEANGVWVAWLLAVPFVISGTTLVLSYAGYTQSGYGKMYLWTAAVALLVASGVGFASIGMFYLPTAFLLLAAAIVQSRRKAVV